MRNSVLICISSRTAAFILNPAIHDPTLVGKKDRVKRGVEIEDAAALAW